jgi:hypothetical protein
MISVITCSINTTYLNNFRTSLEKTIGCEYQLIIIHNLQEKLSLCAAYNVGAKKAIFDTLCFIHEDVLFKTENWGKILLNHFEQNTRLGIVGIAGANLKRKMPSSYTQPITNGINPLRYNLIQAYKKQKKTPHLMQSNPANEILSEVVCVDGVFLATKKHIWQEFPFDEELLDGFHAYDLSFCLQIGQKYKIGVCHDVLVEHLSEGENNTDWFINNLKVHQKWKHSLPRTIDPDSKYNFFEADLAALAMAYHILKKSHLKTKNKILFFMECLTLFSEPLTLVRFFKVLEFFFKKAIKKNK